ncbi:uncharacterized protein K441DRAFT_543014, partial [Cenococcum geophilum 1.58]|uniref:uncharacterized protein n=1 Tax=Cenococcum geophilum 1.58 TaxID=794803 RepID=UPI00358E2469
HANIISTLEVYRFKGTSYIVFKYMAYSISYNASNPRLNKIRLAILNGLAYFTEKGFEHSSLTYLNILIYLYGDIKISYLENCYASISNGASKYVKALSSIVTELINGYVKEDGAISVNNLRR